MLLAAETSGGPLASPFLAAAYEWTAISFVWMVRTLLEEREREDALAIASENAAHRWL